MELTESEDSDDVMLRTEDGDRTVHLNAEHGNLTLGGARLGRRRLPRRR